MLRRSSLVSQLARLASSLPRRGFQSIPVIDVAPLVQPNQGAAAKAAVARQLDAACRDVGFFYVRNHGVPANVTDEVLAQARAWFALPEAVKRQIAVSPAAHFRGYQGLGANVTRYDGGFQRDWHEAIDLYREEQASAVGRPASPLHGPNQWPGQLPAFEAALRQYVDTMLGLGASLMRGIALGLGLEERFFEAGASPATSYWVVRVIHYPPLAAAPEHTAAGGELAESAAAALDGAEVARSTQLSCGEHTDYGLLTLVNQEPHVSALQVKNAAGQWITADPIPGTFVCNIGDMLKVWTNGAYTPTAHRVINADRSRSRVSIPFFYEPAFEARVAPPPQLLAGGPPRFAPVRYGDHLERKVLNNFEL